eukprot:SM000032S12056  [mRNA]  locus=s32:197846:198105:+ [translate_table: standard]
MTEGPENAMSERVEDGPLSSYELAAGNYQGKGSPIEDRGWKGQPNKEGTKYEKGARGSAKNNKHKKKQSSYVLLSNPC